MDSVRVTPVAALGVEQVEQGVLFGVVGLGRVAGGRADAAVVFLDQFVDAELLGRS